MEYAKVNQQVNMCWGLFSCQRNSIILVMFLNLRGERRAPDIYLEILSCDMMHKKEHHNTSNKREQVAGRKHTHLTKPAIANQFQMDKGKSSVWAMATCFSYSFVLFLSPFSVCLHISTESKETVFGLNSENRYTVFAVRFKEQ